MALSFLDDWAQAERSIKPKDPPVPLEVVEPQSRIKRVARSATGYWDGETRYLIEYLTDYDAKPSEPIVIGHETITDLSLYISSLLEDSLEGPNGPRAKYGALQKDLRTIVNYLKLNAK